MDNCKKNSTASIRFSIGNYDNYCNITDIRSGHVKESAADFVAGSIGGIALVLVGQPLDTVKTKLQTFRGLYRGPAHCLMHTYRTTGIRGLYAGTYPALIASVAENSVLFLCYGLCQRMVASVTGARDIKQLDVLSNATAGCVASFFSSVVLCPTELIKIKLQAGRELAKSRGEKFNGGVLRVTKELVNNNGVLALFRGLTITLARELPSYFCFFGAYEAIRETLKPEGGSREDCGLVATSVAGGVGGILLWAVTFPVDVVKSRIQLDDAISTRRWVPMLMNIYQNEGFSALYSGLAPTLVRTVPSSAMLFIVYEYTKKLMSDR
ncbi:mitochondrial ornithine transporter 1-like isoform X1 [Daktulosphaira vitifoliae]|uniref:mitochondrial ornithine transporter 1-like isoform X1 n=1 Tax=Daktulosphaira vitifoliae TaxID=58002 RepID=UPI0021A9A6E0|nr:mitochondrial ornithine transporter 1-like isoform X1 [Daktulosphaira vitifoliae]